MWRQSTRPVLSQVRRIKQLPHASPGSHCWGVAFHSFIHAVILSVSQQAGYIVVILALAEHCASLGDVEVAGKAMQPRASVRRVKRMLLCIMWFVIEKLKDKAKKSEAEANLPSQPVYTL